MRRDVTVSIGEIPRVVGTLHFEAQGNREFCTFEYARSWLTAADRFALGPDLPLVARVLSKAAATQVTDRSGTMFGMFSDSGPHSWGRRLVLRNVIKSKGTESGTSAHVSTLDHLLAVRDFARIGALRLTEGADPSQEPREAELQHVPRLALLSQLMRAAKAVERSTETAEDLRLLLDHGSPLGGARPKASVHDARGELAIAKFAGEGDEVPLAKGEVLALRLARLAGVTAAEGSVVVIEGQPISIIRRFDRMHGKRKPYISAATAMLAHDAGPHTYTEFAEAIRACSPDVPAELRQLWRRVVFGILITNTDDHLNNHGFLHHSGDRWRLAPAFDVNPSPGKSRNLKTWISKVSGPSADLEFAIEAAEQFSIDPDEARSIVREVESAVAQWRRVGADVGMTAREIHAFAPAFEHRERDQARRFISTSSITSTGQPSRS